MIYLKWYLYFSLGATIGMLLTLAWGDFRVYLWPKKYHHDPKFGPNFSTILWIYPTAAMLPVLNFFVVYVAFIYVRDWIKDFIIGRETMTIQLITPDMEFPVEEIKRTYKAIRQYMISKGCQGITKKTYLRFVVMSYDDRFKIMVDNNPAAYISKKPVGNEV